MRVVITGAAGFIGSHLTETLLDQGHRVVGIDNLLTGDLSNIAHLRDRDFQALAAHPDYDGRGIRVLDVVNEALGMSLKAPMVIRFQDLLRHRVVLSPAAEIDGRRTDDIVAQLIDRVEAPR